MSLTMKTAYREEVRHGHVVPGQHPLPQCDQDKGDECGPQERRTKHAPILIDGAVVEHVESFRARQNLFPLRRLKRFGMGPQILKRLYSCTVDSILPGCVTAWYGNCSASDPKTLQRVVHMAQYITRTKLPALQDLYTKR